VDAVAGVDLAYDQDSTAMAPPRLGGILAVVAAVGAPELLIMQGYVLAAAAVDAVMVFLLLNAESLRVGPLGRALPTPQSTTAMRVLAIVPFSRVISVALPLSELSLPVAQLVTAALVGLSVIGLASHAGLSRGVVLKSQGGGRLVATGAVLGFVGYLFGAPVLVESTEEPLGILIALVAASTAAAVEEVVFRGLVQRSLQRVAGQAGILAAVALFVCTYLGFGSLPILLLVAFAGLRFARTVAQADAVGDVIVGHIVLTTGATVIWPLLLGTDRPSRHLHPDISFLEPVPTVALALAVAAEVLSLAWPNSAREPNG
jgi:membrane protease YdiL (CAAX protease family)